MNDNLAEALNAATVLLRAGRALTRLSAPSEQQGGGGDNEILPPALQITRNLSYFYRFVSFYGTRYVSCIATHEDLM